MTQEQKTLNALLEQAYLAELETACNYLANGSQLVGAVGREMGLALLEDVGEELGHAKRLATRMAQLGHRVPGSFALMSAVATGSQASLQPRVDCCDWAYVAKGVVEAEANAIALYNKVVLAARAAADPVTEQLALDILEDELEHMRVFDGYRASSEPAEPARGIKTARCGDGDTGDEATPRAVKLRAPGPERQPTRGAGTEAWAAEDAWTGRLDSAEKREAYIKDVLFGQPDSDGGEI